jgi:hypothetical protein
MRPNRQDVRTGMREPTRRGASTAGWHKHEHPRQDGQHPAALHGRKAANERVKMLFWLLSRLERASGT